MSPSQTEQELFPRITNKLIAKKISEALHKEHADVHSASKQMERITGINTLTACNWYKGRNVPNASNLLMLMAYYPEVLHTICELMGMDQIWQCAVQVGIIDTMRKRLDRQWTRWKKSTSIGDKSVTIQVRVDRHLTGQMNQRQLWFLGQLQQGYKMHIHNLMEVWGIHERTGKRDLSGMIKAGLVTPIRSGRKCQYVLP